MRLSKQDIENKGKVERLNLVNSITGIKPANLIGTVDNDGKTNLGIFSSVIHLGSFPALIGFIMRPKGDVPRHTYENIMDNGFYTINHVHPSFVKQAHYTSAKFEKEESEFDEVNLQEEYLDGFKAPFVEESLVKMGLKFVEEIPIKQNGTILIIGEIQLIDIPDHIVDEIGQIDLSGTSTGISGLNRYYDLNLSDEFPYVRRTEVPHFK